MKRSPSRLVQELSYRLFNCVRGCSFPSMATAFTTKTIQGEKPTPRGPVISATLPNGIVVKTRETGMVQASLGIYVDAGPKYDPPETPGLSGMIRALLLRGTFLSSPEEFALSLRRWGYSYSDCELRKRWIGVKGTAQRGLLKNPATALGECIAIPKFTAENILRQQQQWEIEEEEERWMDPRRYCIDELEATAFFKKPLGAPRRCVERRGKVELSPDMLFQHWKTVCTPKRIVVGSLGVPLEKVVDAMAALPLPAEEVTDSPMGLRTDAVEAAQFTEGRQDAFPERREQVIKFLPQPETIAAVGWCVPAGADSSPPQFAAALVMRECIAAVLKEAPVASADGTGTVSFGRSYSTASLLGATCRGSPEAVADEIHRVVEEVKGLGKRAAFSLEEVRCRAACRFHTDNLEQAADEASFMVTHSATEEEVFAAIGEVGKEELLRMAENIAAMAPCTFATGQVLKIPSLRQLGFKQF